MVEDGELHLAPTLKERRHPSFREELFAALAFILVIGLLCTSYVLVHLQLLQAETWFVSWMGTVGYLLGRRANQQRER